MSIAGNTRRITRRFVCCSQRRFACSVIVPLLVKYSLRYEVVQAYRPNFYPPRMPIATSTRTLCTRYVVSSGLRTEHRKSFYYIFNSRSFFVGFSRPKTDFLSRFFGCPKKSDSFFFGRFCFTDHGSKQNNRNRPDFFGENPKNRLSHFYFRCIFGPQPWSPHDTNTEPFEMLRVFAIYQVMSG